MPAPVLEFRWIRRRPAGSQAEPDYNQMLRGVVGFTSTFAASICCCTCKATYFLDFRLVALMSPDAESAMTRGRAGAGVCKVQVHVGLVSGA